MGLVYHHRVIWASCTSNSYRNVHFCAARVYKPNQAGTAMASSPGLAGWIVRYSLVPRHAVG